MVVVMSTSLFPSWILSCFSVWCFSVRGGGNRGGKEWEGKLEIWILKHWWGIQCLPAGCHTEKAIVFNSCLVWNVLKNPSCWKEKCIFKKKKHRSFGYENVSCMSCDHIMTCWSDINKFLSLRTLSCIFTLLVTVAGFLKGCSTSLNINNFSWGSK